ncbi:SusC/RagA family TonB-linked outer membrane protein [Flavobacterium buctense]|uniref:SusC/RagA family TonB-linked outer membrane protein n=1 Tax=Flavobacterium buctense TaxID=1648146 RepID=A0ABU9E2L7_9FLAO|nr:SusC/RagA family TonB-linked outer membrane protein [Flavobacterium buctense]
MKIFLAYFLLLTFGCVTYAQEVKGKVIDVNGMPLPGTNVVVKGKNISTSTDFDGVFSLKADTNDIIEFSMIGFETISLKAQSNMTVTLNESNQLLKEVIVVGYGTKKAGSITGSVAQIKATEIVKTPAQSAIQAIQGKAAGVNIVTNDEPGANPSIRIRGLGTVLGGRDPLYIIDGLEASSLNGLSPNEIETIDILKDASSLAIYGQKGSNGVVVVSTKKGKSGKLKMDYNSYYGLKMIQREVEMSDAYRYVYYNNTALGSSSYFNFDQPYNTNWLDEITSNGEVVSHNISLSGGSENASFYFGATNLKEKGILNGTEFERTNLNSRNEYSFFDKKLKISQSVNLSIVKNTPKPLSAFTNAYKQSPIVPVRFDNGRWGVPLRNPSTGQVDINGNDRFNNVGNPAAQLFYTNEKNKNLVLFGNIGAEMQVTKELKFNSNFGATFDWSKGYTFTPSREIWLSQNPTEEIADYPVAEPINILQQRRGDSYRWNWDNYFTYSKLFGKHDLKATVGMNRSTSNITENLSASRWNVPAQSNYWSLDLSTYNNEVAPGSIVSNKRETPLVSLAYFGRLDYEYNEKYLFSATIRREGISTFQESKRWAVFPAFSGGWIMSNEDFLKEVSFLNYLKIRGGYGEVGNGNSLYALNIPVFAAGYNYTFGANETIFPGNNQPYQVDPNLTWETMKEIDFGIDFKVLGNKLSGSIDFYDRKSENVILPVELPDVLSPEPVTLNTGTVSNKGLELSLKWSKEINDNWSYSINGNISFNKNELTGVNNAYFADYIGGSINNGQWTKQVLVGESLGSFYVYQVTGIDGDGNFTYSDERVVAGSYLPTYTYGLSFAINYKKFDFSVDTYGVGGNKLYNGKKAQRFGGENVEYDVLEDFWTPGNPNPNAANPAPFNIVPRSSTYYIEDGAYLRINNITLGYTFPKFFGQIDKVRLYATAINPFIFTKYSGYSPELSGNNNADPLGSAGIELDAYPTNKTFLLGLNVSF